MTTDQLASAAIPMLSYEDPARAADRVAEAFGFRETGRWADADGRVTHVNMERNGAIIMLGSPGRDYQNPRHHAETCDHARAWLSTPFIVDGVLVYPDDIDVHFERVRPASPSCPRSKTTTKSVSGSIASRIWRATAGCSRSSSVRMPTPTKAAPAEARRPGRSRTRPEPWPEQRSEEQLEPWPGS